MDNENKKDSFIETGHELADKVEDPFIEFLHKIIRVAVKVLATLMVLVIVWGIGDIIYVLYQRLIAPPFLLLSISDILATFDAFLAVLLAIEIFINITLYLKTNVILVRLVVATALMAISRKVIIFDFKEITPLFILTTASKEYTNDIRSLILSKKVLLKVNILLVELVH